MFTKRDDGMGLVLLPFDIGALLLAALFLRRSGVRGPAAIPAFIGLWLCGFAAIFLAFYFVILLISFTVDMKKPFPMEDHPFYRAVVITVIGQVCRFSRVRIHFDGGDKLPKGRFLIVSNHRSAYDPIVTVWALRKTPTAFITKPENHRIPLAGPLIYQTNFLPIDRETPREAIKTVNAAAALLRKDVVSVGVYPEGTRNRAPSEGLLPFHNGVFKIAQKADVPLVVACISGTERIARNLPWRHTDVVLHLCGTIPADALGTSTGDLSLRVREMIEAGLRESESRPR